MIFSSLISLSLISFTFTNDIVKKLSLGESSCKVLIVGKEQKFAKFISLHENEHTSIEGITNNINSSTFNCKLYILKQNGDRRLKYILKGKSYFFDPNRIFSLKGIKATLLNCNKSYPSELENRVKSFSDSLLLIMDVENSKNYIIAIHNNTNDKFSVLSYKKSRDAEQVYVNNDEDIDDFFIVTSATDYEHFKSKKLNVVLQSENAEDDGSLSIYCQKNGLKYINIEAELGHKDKQIKMIKETYSLIKNKSK